MEDRSFTVAERKLRIDAVQAASFVTKKKTEELTDKIAALSGTHRGEVLKHNTLRFHTRKHSNEQILYNIDALEEALQNRCSVRFRCFDLDIHARHICRRNGAYDVGEPVALVFNEDNCYAVVFSPRYGDTANYRVDRMEGVEVLQDVPISKKALKLRDTIPDYMD